MVQSNESTMAGRVGAIVGKNYNSRGRRYVWCFVIFVEPVVVVARIFVVCEID